MFVFKAKKHSLSFLGDYFGLSYKSKNGSIDNYLDPNKSLMEQLPKNQQNQNSPRLKFRVRFYPPDPQRLKEEASRHWLYLQMRADMLAGLLDASDEASAELAAYSAQVSYPLPIRVKKLSIFQITSGILRILMEYSKLIRSL